MRAYQLPKGGAGIDALVKIERPNPTPAYRQVLVKVMACSLAPNHYSCGHWPFARERWVAIIPM
jgi:NADPH:quinone reductase-like Zn-dependent oxidoreductase